MIPHRKRVQSLLDKRGRREHHQFLIEGVRLVEEALAADLAIERLYHIAAPSDTRLSRVLELASGRGVRLAQVTPDELLSLSDTQTPQGVIAVAFIPRWSEDDIWATEERRGDVLILDGVRDPGNLGTLIRTAEAAAARGVFVTPGTVELTNPKVVRSAMGALFRFPAVVITAHERVAARCQESRLPLVLTSVRTGEAVTRLRAHPSVVLVLGGEAEGAGQVWESLADMVVRLPMSPTTESLNVAVAGGILLFRHIWYPSDEGSEAQTIA